MAASGASPAAGRHVLSKWRQTSFRSPRVGRAGVFHGSRGPDAGRRALSSQSGQGGLRREPSGHKAWQNAHRWFRRTARGARAWRPPRSGKPRHDECAERSATPRDPLQLRRSKSCTSHDPEDQISTKLLASFIGHPSLPTVASTYARAASSRPFSQAVCIPGPRSGRKATLSMFEN